MILQGRNLTQGLTGADVADLQTELAQLAFTIPATEQQASQFGAGTLAAVEAFQTAQNLPANGTIDAATAAALTSVIAASTYVVTGVVSSTTSASVGALAVQLVDKNVGGDVNVASTTTEPDGSYKISSLIAPATLRARHKSRPDFQVRVSARAVGASQTLLAASVVQYDATLTTTLNVVLPATTAGLPSEYETLTAAIGALYTGPLAQLQETAQQQDVTFLANKAGWDARSVAMASLADQFGETTTPAPAPASGAPPPPISLQPAFYYALFRAGLPANADQLFQASASSVEAIWRQAITQGVIPASLQSSLATAVQNFQALGAAHILTMAPKIGVSTLQAQMAPILTNSSQQTQFASLLSQYHDDWSKLWPAVTTAFGATVTQQLQLAGQLHFLSRNNAPLLAALNSAEAQNPLKAPLDLVTRGYYQASKWTPLIAGSAPPGIPGATPAAQAVNYAGFLAAQIRIAFPTAVLADQVRNGAIPVAGASTVIEEVATFLASNQAGFAIGAEPIQSFLTRENITTLSAAAVTQIKRLQRAYQLTADDSSMAMLLRHNLDSAYAITRYDQAGFVRAFSSQLGGAAPAKRLHDRAKQIFSGVLNIATTYAGGMIGSLLGNIGKIIHPGPSGGALPNVPASATLQGLFGSLDYCDCSDCSSILSPAAYLVDLLHYIDQPSPTQGFENPQSVLFTRRPDLQYLPLTCENTNVALPYIDIVNETLEYFVANGLSLANYQGHDTGSVVTSAELLASPQYVNDAAYTALQGAFFPAPLPFNRPLELLRLQLQNLGVAVPDAMIALRADDRISNRTTPTSYGWSDILIEQLGVSRDEYRLFTDSTLQLGDLYGLPNATALATLQTMNLQTFSRLVGVSYTDLVAILQTQFINPSVSLIPKLQALGVTFAAIKNLHDNLSAQPSLAAQFIAALPPGLDPTQYGGPDLQAVVNWLVNATNYAAIMNLITITNPSGTGDDCSGSTLQFRYANPDSAQNLLSATDFLKLIRFIRLWAKLQPLLNETDDSITIADADAILAALYPAADLPAQPANVANDPANRPLLDAGFATTLMRAGFLFQAMNRLSLTADAALLQLLACWAPIGVVGPNALYQSIFLTPTLLQQDPGAQVATISPTVNVGDRLATQINNVSLTHIVVAGETASAVATSIAAAINADATVDQVSGAPLNARFLATALSNQVIVRAGFALSCTGGGGGESFIAAIVSPLSKTATIAGSPNVGSTLTATIDTVPISYVVAPGDTLATIAANIAIAVNSATVAHPYSGLPLNTLVSASATSGVVTIGAANAGAPFTLLCSIQSANAATYTAGPPVAAGYTATLSGAVAPGDVLTITLNGVPFTYAVKNSDATTALLAASVANAINTSVEQDPTTLLPFGSLVHATSSANVVTVNPIDPATSFTLAIARTSGAETIAMTGPSPASQTATVAGAFPPGAVLTTSINGLNLFYTVAASDTAASIANAIAQSINNPTPPDPVYNLPLDSFVLASASAGAITVAARNPTIAFTLVVAASASSYVAGRLSPPFADNGYGVYLTDSTQTLFGHEPLLCAACNLTGAEFAQIATALNFNATTVLSLANVSALFRYGWLAHTLNLSVPEFLSLRQFSGLDPFAALDPLAATPAEPPVIRFIGLLQAMNNGNLPTVQALYLIWNQDISGTLAPAQSQIAALCFSLRADFAAVEAQFTLQDDPDGGIAQSLMALVYTTAVTDFFFGLLNNTFTVSVPFAYASPTLPQTVVAAGGGQLAYDPAGLQLSYSGLLTNAAETAIAAAASINTTDAADAVAAGLVTLTPVSMANIAPGAVLVIDSGASREIVVVATVTATTFTTTTTQAHNGTVTPFAIANDPNLTAQLAALAGASQQAAAPFFAAYPELQPLYLAYAASTDPIPTRRNTLLANFLPTLKSIRKQEQALAEITASIGCDPGFASALLQNPTVLHADADPTAAAVTDLTAIEAGGLTAKFFLGDNLGATPDQTIDAASPMQYAQTALLSGTPATGAVLTTTINGVAIAYTTLATDTTLPTLAGSVTAAINACTTRDAVSGLPINRLLSAAVVSGGAIAITGRQPLAANSVFTLTCASSVGGLAYTAGLQLPAGHSGGPIAAVWQGFITVPQNADYNFAVVTDAGATVTLQIGGVPAPLGLASGVWTNQTPVALADGALTPIVLSATSIKTIFAFGWQSPPGLGWGVVPPASLYPLNLFTRLSNTYARFLKATSLASALPLTAADIAWLGTDPARSVNTTCASVTAIGAAQFTPQSMANIVPGSVLALDTGAAQETVTVTAVAAASFTAVATQPHNGAAAAFPIVSVAAPGLNLGWLNALPGQPDPNPAVSPLPDVATASRLTLVLTALLDFARIKQALSPGDERLLTLLQAPGATLPNGQSALLSLTGWALVSVNALLTQFFGGAAPGALADVVKFARVYDAMQIVQTCRVAASTLIAATTNAPTATIVATLQSALRGLYAESDWLTVVQPINDSIRTRQRDALVAYILQALSSHAGNTIQTTDDLYEWFLIDPLTQPPVETSRIRLALSTVQLFIERIVRNLEPLVSTADIDATQWEWMKRYRVWEANREVFLWPENWLYPQLRDDQSPMFEQMMSTLSQGDITDDVATEAYLDYLSSLEEVAKLEPCGLYYAPGTADADEISYVVARTAGANRTYYFRQLQNGAWTPWAQVPIECEDMPLTPIVWNNRLFLFWLKILKQSPLAPSSASQPQSPTASKLKLTDATVGELQTAGPATLVTQVVVRAVLCWSEYYNGKWQSMKTSDLNRPTTIGTYDPTGDGSFEAFRNQVWIVPGSCTGQDLWSVLEGAGPLPDIAADALILAISTPQNLYPWLNGEPLGGAGPLPGFVMHNTHSLPIPFEDIAVPGGYPFGTMIDIPAPSRILAPPYNPYFPPVSPYTGGNNSNSFGIYYNQTVYDAISGTSPFTAWILDFNWLPRTVDTQPGLPDAWLAPFLYEDRRNQFYVTTTLNNLTFTEFIGFGAGEWTYIQQPKIPTIPPLQLGAGASAAKTIKIGVAARSPLLFQGVEIRPTGGVIRLPTPAPLHS